MWKQPALPYKVVAEYIKALASPRTPQSQNTTADVSQGIVWTRRDLFESAAESWTVHRRSFLITARQLKGGEG